MNTLQIVGLILIVSAFGGQIVFPGTVVTYSTGTPSILCWPRASDPNNPCYIQPNAQIHPFILMYNIQYAEVSSASVQISSWTGTAWTTIGTYQLPMMGYTSFGDDFTLNGETPGKLYCLSYAVVTTDVGTFTDLEYIKVASLTGYFSINNIPVTIASTLTVHDPNLSIQYAITGSGVTQSQVTAYVQLLNGSAQLQQVNLTPSTTNNTLFTGSVILPAPGTYTLNGYVTFAGSTQLQMSIVAPWGNLNSIESTMSLSAIYWTMGIFGVVFVAVGSRKKKERSK